LRLYLLILLPQRRISISVSDILPMYIFSES
jgi:hypothetical protein